MLKATLFCYVVLLGVYLKKFWFLIFTAAMTKAVTAIFDSERSHIYQSTHEFIYSISNLIMPLFDFTPLYKFSFLWNSVKNNVCLEYKRKTGHENQSHSCYYGQMNLTRNGISDNNNGFWSYVSEFTRVHGITLFQTFL